MSEPKYTLTLYIAPPGGKRVNSQGERLTDSGPGHVYYAIQKEGEEKRAYGFSPAKEFSAREMWRNKGIDLEGKVVPNEHKTYANPAYMRTMEISKEQYEKLKAFGEASVDKEHATKVFQLTKGKFSTAKYNLLNNSCVDYVFNALRYSGVYNHQERKMVSEFDPYQNLPYGDLTIKKEILDSDGKLNVLRNAETFNKIPLKTIQIHDETKQKLKELPWWSPYRVGELNAPTLSPTAQQLAQQCETKLIAACKANGLVADSPQDYTNIAMALTAKCVAADMHKIEKLDIKKEDYSVYALSYEPQLKLASVMANEVVNIPAHESAEKIQQMEQAQARQSQERQLAQEQSQQRGMSIG